jgi:hypothetical protein
VKRAAALIALALLNACAAVDRIAPAGEAAASTAVGEGSTAGELLAYLARLRNMGESALNAEAARRKREAGDLARVKTALALSLSPQADESDILALVDPIARKESADRDVKAMASFLQVLATERRRLKESAAASAVRLRDERRAHDAQKERAEALQQKLDALTDLEKSLSERPDPSR